MMWFIPKNKKAIFILTAGLTLSLGCLCLVAGCKDKDSTPAEKPPVVKKRIEPAAQTPTGPEAEKAAATSVGDIAASKPAEEKTEASEADAPKTDSSTAAVAETPSAASPEAKSEEKTPAAPGAAEADTGAATDKTGQASLVSSLMDDSIPKYDPTGKIDPFAALFDESETDSAEDNEPKRPLTPLEKIDISQLKLVAVLLAQSGNRAMVEDVTGKPYILTLGTFVGINSGTVQKILKDRVVIEEKTKDFLGRETASTRELKLQKPFGEE